MATVPFQIFVFAENRHAAQAAGHDIFTMQTDLASRALEIHALAPAAEAKSTTDRLVERDALKSAGSITAEEYDAQRARILGSI